ncbi:MAG: nucleotidyltransferase family protein [Kiritimatiellae bacterium]|nr:nucleotidyltransferase family protein [Kiritimatiellia bacterium]
MTKEELLNFCIPAQTPILEALKIIDHGLLGMAMVTNESGQLVGMVADGDVRRGLLRGVTLQDSVETVMNPSPVTANRSTSRSMILKTMVELKLHQMPITDDEGRIVNLVVFDELVTPGKKENLVVLMAGGEGKRLRPLTNDTPKPMLKVGDRPILETILESFLDLGFYRFVFAVNYKASQIQKHFGDGSKWGVSITYLEEDTPLGTAGALSLLQERPEQPIFVMNGDILTKVNYSRLLDFHQSQKSEATMCVRKHSYEVPYGVVNYKDSFITSIEEKPNHKYFVNAGVYVINPSCLDLLKKDQPYNMTTLFSDLIAKQKPTTVFPLREYWIDIGRQDKFDQAITDYQEHFKDSP